MSAGWSLVSTRVEVLAEVWRVLGAAFIFRFARGMSEVVRRLRKVTAIVKHQTINHVESAEQVKHVSQSANSR
jgi:hypothetical protein